MKVSRRTSRKKSSTRKASRRVSSKKSSTRKASRRVSSKKSSTRKVSRKKSSTRKASRRVSSKKSSTRKASRRTSRKKSSTRKVSRKKSSTRKASRRVSSKKSSTRKASRRVSSKKSSTRKASRRTSRKKSVKDVLKPLPIFKPIIKHEIPYIKSKVFDYKKTPIGFKLPKAKTNIIPSNFKGTAFYNLVSLLYFSKKYECCLVIPPKTEFIEISKMDKYFQTDIFYKYSKLTINKEFINIFKICNKRFIIFPVSFFSSIGRGGHANMLIYDNKTKELERFDPHGKMTNFDYTVMYSDFDKEIQKEFKNNGIEISNYYTPLDFCPSISFQKLEKDDKKIIGDPGGFCQAWSSWYVDLRLSNPDLPRDDVVQIAIRKIKQDPKGFKSFIRSYASFLSEMGEDFKNSNFDTSIFDKYKEKL